MEGKQGMNLFERIVMWVDSLIDSWIILLTIGAILFFAILTMRSCVNNNYNHHNHYNSEEKKGR